MAVPETTLKPKTVKEFKSVQDVLGTFHDPAEINARMEWAAKHCNLISPESSIGQLPPGWGIAFTIARICVQHYYPVDDRERRFSFNKRGATVIANEAAIDWDPTFTRRTDDGKNPRFVEFSAVGVYRRFDSTHKRVTGSRRSNLLEGSDDVEKISAIERANDRNPEKRLRWLRTFILEHAESKAKVRAMKDYGVQDSYTRDQMALPFVIAKLVWTADSADPAIRLELARFTAQMAASSMGLLYGSPSTAETGGSASPPPAPPRADAPPPWDIAPAVPQPSSVITVAPEGESSATIHAVPAAQPEHEPVHNVTIVPPAEESFAPAPPVEDQDDIAPSLFKVPFGKTAGTPFSEASDRDLNFFSTYYPGVINNPDKAQYREQNELALRAVLKVKRLRQAAAAVKASQREMTF